MISVAEAGSQAIGFVLTAVLARWGGTQVLGVFAIALAFSALLSPLVELGLNRIIVRESARSPEQSGTFVAAALLIRALAAVPVLGLALAVAHGLGYPSETVSMIGLIGAVACLGLLQAAFRMQFYAFQKMEFDAVTRLLERIVATGLGIWVIISGHGLVWIGVAFVVASLGGLVVTWLIARVKFGRLPLRSLDYAVCVSLLRPAWPLAIAGILVAVYFRVDVVILSILADESAAGLYSAARNLVLALTLVSLALNSSVFPILSQQYAHDRRAFETTLKTSLRYALLIAVPMGFGLMALADSVISILYGPEFSGAVPLLRILAAGLVLMFVTSFFGMVSVAIHRQGWIAVIALCNVLFNISLNVVLVPRLGALGSAVASVLTELLGLSIYLFLISRAMGMLPVPRSLAQIVVAALLMGLAVRAAAPLGFLFAVAVGVCAFVMLFALLGGLSDEDRMALREVFSGAHWEKR